VQRRGVASRREADRAGDDNEDGDEDAENVLFDLGGDEGSRNQMAPTQGSHKPQLAAVLTARGAGLAKLRARLNAQAAEHASALSSVRESLSSARADVQCKAAVIRELRSRCEALERDVERRSDAEGDARELEAELRAARAEVARRGELVRALRDRCTELETHLGRAESLIEARDRGEAPLRRSAGGAPAATHDSACPADLEALRSSVVSLAEYLLSEVRGMRARLGDSESRAVAPRLNSFHNDFFAGDPLLADIARSVGMPEDSAMQQHRQHPVTETFDAAGGSHGTGDAADEFLRHLGDCLRTAGPVEGLLMQLIDDVVLLSRAVAEAEAVANEARISPPSVVGAA
jgi:hypothetical protein